jgi:imidazolonepropionase-like amidohydrolase
VAAAVAGGVDFVEHGFFAQEGAVAAFARGESTWVPTSIPVEVVARGHALSELSDAERAGVRGILDGHAQALRAVQDAGGAIIAGSDSGSPGVWEAGGVLGELRCFRDAGLALPDVLALATRRAAAALGLDHLTGSIEPGKRADLLVVGGSPLETLDALRDVRLVVRDGFPIQP